MGGANMCPPKERRWRARLARLTMTVLTDRRIVIAGAAAAVTWAACIVLLWSYTLDASGTATMLTLLAMLLATASVGARGRRLARVAAWALSWVGAASAEPLAVASGNASQSRRLSGHEVMGLYGLAAGAALAGGLLSTLVVYAALPLFDYLIARFGWTSGSWALVQLAIQWAALLPLGAGFVALFAAGALVRRDPRPHRLATASREHLVGTALGLAAFAAAWVAEANMLYLAGAMAVALMGVLYTSLAVENVQTPSRGFDGSSEPVPLKGGRLLLVFAGLAFVLVTQMRLLSDLMAFGTPTRAMWIAGSLVLLAAVLRRAERGAESIHLAGLCGAVLGGVFVVGLQTALAFVCLAGGPRWAVAGVCAALLQWPLAMLSAGLIARQRLRFVNAGGTPGGFMAVAAGGASLGLLLQLLGGTAWFSWLPMAVVLAAGVAAGVAGAVALPTRPARVAWSISAAVLLALSVLAVESAARGLGGPQWRVLSGTWLRLRVREGDDKLPEFESALPTVSTWRSAAVDAVFAEILSAREGRSRHRGRWWVVAGSKRDWPEAEGVYSAAAIPDPSPLSHAQISGVLLLGPEGAYLVAARIGQEQYDGVMLAPVAADHPDAWRLYNYQTLRRCYDRIFATGNAPMALRTQADEEHLDDLFRVARTFVDVVGPSWAVVGREAGRVDLLLIGPKARNGRAVVRQPAPQPGALVLSAEQLWPADESVRPVQILRPHSPFRRATVRPNLWYYHVAQAAARIAPPVDDSDQ